MRKMNPQMLDLIVEGLDVGLCNTNETLIVYHTRPSQLYTSRLPRGAVQGVSRSIASVDGLANAVPNIPAVFGGGGGALHVTLPLSIKETVKTKAVTKQNRIVASLPATPTKGF